MDKYYTPELEEFYIGFEYETCNFKNKIWIKKITDINIISLTSCIYDENPELFKNEYRVKYLDKKDIESLGFKFKIDLYTKDDLTLQVHKNSITIKYYDNLNNEWRTKVEQIIIKNKSELIKLLKQLQIE